MDKKRLIIKKYDVTKVKKREPMSSHGSLFSLDKKSE